MERNMEDMFEKYGLVTVPINPPMSKNGPRMTRHIYWRKRSVEKVLHSDTAQSTNTTIATSTSSINDATSSSKDMITSSDIISTINRIYDDPESVSRYLFDLLRSPHDDNDLQGELIDLLGFEQFDLVGKILSSRQKLLDCYNSVRQDIAQTTQLERILQKSQKQRKQPLYCQQVTVQSNADVNIRKMTRREQKRATKQLNKIAQILSEDEKLELERAQNDVLKESVRFQELETERWLETLRESRSVLRERFPYVYDASIESEHTFITVDGLKRCLPINSTHTIRETYEEVYVPAGDRSQIKGVHQINIENFDELGKKCFDGFEKLNIVQSLVFTQAYKSQENLLICAPTGAGKTNIALLAILNTVHGYMNNGVICKNDFKIVYIAPMKALATEMTMNFAKRLAPLNLRVRELTGDTTLSRKEITETQMLVLTPEKWDVVTRKAIDLPFIKMVRLLIIDEIHLLHDDRGPVIETIVARTLRQVEMSQQGVRIIGLSATLPNYIDVAKFLHVNPRKGLFFFDGRFRPVPLSQTFIGVRNPQCTGSNLMREMDEVCYEKVHQFVSKGHQVLVFVTARNATTKLATTFRDEAAKKGELNHFLPASIGSSQYVSAMKSVQNCKVGMLTEFFRLGFGIHHAGLPRRERLMTEKFFANGHITVLFCTSTLAWGINLPAHAVVIRGTEIFDVQKGAFCDMGVLDVQQIFGRAGRPQYESSGHGIIITWKKSMPQYLNMLLRQVPIESKFMSRIYDNLNAEISLGTVSSIPEAVEWLKYTYFFIRAKLNPIAYGIPREQLVRDPDLHEYLTRMMTEAAEKLDRNQMIRFDSINGYLAPTDLGRIASNYYIKYETVEVFMNGVGGLKLEAFMSDDMILSLIALATEFGQIKVREEESMELEELVQTSCPLRLKKGALATVPGKVYCLIQAYISRAFIRNHSLVSESMFVQQNCGRLCRAMFEITLRKGWAQAANATLAMAKCFDKQVWSFQTPLRQLNELIRADWIPKIERRKLSHYQLFEMSAKELGNMLSCDGQKMYEAVRMLPVMCLEASVKPVTNTIIQVTVILTPDFIWHEKFLGSTGIQLFWVFVEDINENMIIHHDQIVVNRNKVRNSESQNLIFTIPIRDQQLTHNYQVRVSNDRYVVDDSVVPISMHNCVLPSSHRPNTDLLDLDPLPLTALKNEAFQSIYNFQFFNPVQTQVFHCLYNTDQNALIGAPTGSGKTLCAELAMYRIFREYPAKKCVYIAPLKALVRERVSDWDKKFRTLNIRTVELTGDHSPDIRSLSSANIVITTPEKWDGITRSWEIRQYVKDVALVVVDEIHLLGVERGAVLEAIITRLKLMAAKQESHNSVRVVGLSTALANAGDVAEWLDVADTGLFNFRPNVRPVPIEVHIAGFPGRHYCPRMALMNRPAFKAIKSYSPYKPALVFVASRRQTRLTAMAFVSQLVIDDDPRQWLHMDMEELEQLITTIKDENLKLTLPFGVGMHHAGLQQHEKNIVERLYVEKKIQVMVATATLAWGINMPAHLVIIKGTEYYDGKTHKYIDFPVTDVLQMIGRAGRPQFDDSAVAVIYVQDVKKNFYKRFLYEPFPVESSLLTALPNHVNAEIYAGTIASKQHVIEYIANTYLYRRLFANPSYYGIVDMTSEALTQFLVEIVDNCIEELVLSSCITVDEEEQSLISAPLGTIASVYYLNHKTVRFFANSLTPTATVEELMKVLADCPEYDEIPVRHNEDQINAQLQQVMPLKLPANAAMDSSHTKAFLLLEAHLSRIKLMTDYITDQRSMLDQCMRILNAMLDISLLRKWLSTALSVIILMQMIAQATWHTDHPLLVLPHFNEEIIDAIGADSTVPMLKNYFGFDGMNIEQARKKAIKKLLDVTIINERQATEAVDALLKWPILQPRNCVLCSTNQVFEIDYLQDERWPKYINVESDMLYRMLFTVEMVGPYRFETDAFCPRFHKEKSAGWIVIIGEKDTVEVLCCKKISSITGSKQLVVPFRMPKKLGRHIFTIFILSDSYIGIDQEYNLHCEITEKINLENDHFEI
ncbi:Sec63 domain protein [Onchocerca flexuosa]|uniref:U5 small nuclear ribonucleoprotein 200 kDa helicase n=2 Tax=Onchocerca flexuosa TaxID=387005 RepID=A0A238BR22_9BILA|nr:Sec63 domain protein [Onchocerca flexuosa]